MVNIRIYVFSWTLESPGVAFPLFLSEIKRVDYAHVVREEAM